MAPRSELEFCVIAISTSGVELGEAMGSIQPKAHKGAKVKGFRGNMGEDVKWVGGDDIREVRDHSNAVPGIGSIIGRSVNGRSGVRKSRGRVRT